jgi:hypothetical protein
VTLNSGEAAQEPLSTSGAKAPGVAEPIAALEALLHPKAELFRKPYRRELLQLRKPYRRELLQLSEPYRRELLQKKGRGREAAPLIC